MGSRRIAAAVLVAAISGLGVAGLVGGPAGAASGAYPVTVESNLCYQAVRGSCVDGASHEFDAYLPVGATQRTPGVVLVHGGSFIGGDKTNFASIGQKLASDGIAAFSINYRLDGPSVVGFPMESQDVLSAIAYLRSHARSFGADPHRFASFGSSAGATLAVYAAMEAARSDPAAQVVADVGWSGGYDFTVGPAGAVDAGQLQNIEYYLGCTNFSDPTCVATAAAASAVTLVQPGDPATLLANSTDYQAGCEIVPPSQAEEMAADLQNVGTPVQLDLNDLCAHALGYGSHEIAPTIAFLESHLFVAPTIRSRSAKTFRVGRPATFTVKSRANPTAGLTESGALPSGLAFVDQGSGRATLAGTAAPGTEGVYPIVISAVNGGAPDAVQDFTVTVVAART